MASKKLRFDVFKRDQFACQYCGRTPPEVILEIDHVIPKSKGGPDDINNYLTACFDCNRGKGANELSTVPSTLKENVEIAELKREQLKAYNQFLEILEKEKEQSYASINSVFKEFYPEFRLSDSYKKNTLKKFLNALPLIKINEAMRVACSKFSGMSNTDLASDKALKYFCGICWNWIKRPETRGW